MKQYSIKSLEGKMILLATILASGMAFLDGSVVNIAIPSIQAQFHAAISGVEWVINSYALLLGALILVSGALGDKFGRKKIFSYGILLFVAASFLCSIAQSIIQLALFRGLQGIGGAMMVPGSLSIITISFDEKIRGKVIGLWSGFAGGVAALGPFLGGWLVQTFGWPSIFYINIPIGLVALFLTIRYVPESRDSAAKGIDRLGATLLFLALLGIVYGLMSGSDMGWQSPVIIGSILVGFVLLCVFIIIEKRKKYPLVPLSIFKSTLVTGANLATFFLYFALSGVIFFLVLNFQQVQHFPPVTAGLGLLPAVLIITFLSGPGGALADKTGPRLPMVVGPLLVALGMLILTIPGRNANYFISFLPGLLFFGLGMSLVIAPLTKSALAVESRYSGAASGVNNAVSRIAGLLAVAVLSAIILLVFSTQLQQRMSTLTISQQAREKILIQENKLAGIEIPDGFSLPEKHATQEAIEDAFVYAFRGIMGINAGLAMLSAVIAYLTIPSKKHT